MLMNFFKNKVVLISYNKEIKNLAILNLTSNTRKLINIMYIVTTTVIIKNLKNLYFLYYKR